jgi:hypothetical protein
VAFYNAKFPCKGLELASTLLMDCVLSFRLVLTKPSNADSTQSSGQWLYRVVNASQKFETSDWMAEPG